MLSRNLFAGTLLLFVAFVVSVPDAAGQGTRRKRTPATSAPSVPAGEAQIISRASDFPVTDPGAPQTPAEKKPEAAATPEDETAKSITELKNRIAGLESTSKKDPDEKQKRLLLNLDILNRAEQRSEALRKQLFEMIEKESTIKSRIDIIEMNMRPEAIDREVALSGSLRPEDLRALKRKQFELERANLQSVLTEVQKTKATLEQNLQRSEAMVEKVRVKLEKEIDSALADDPEQ